jgi:hypothetical protein
MVNTRLVPDDQEVITPGEAVAAMMLNGLGFANRPLSFTPQFCANTPLDLLFREGIKAEMFNRFKLGRTVVGVATSLSPDAAPARGLSSGIHVARWGAARQRAHRRAARQGPGLPSWR